MRALVFLAAIVLSGCLAAESGWRKETGPGAWTKRAYHNTAEFNGSLFAFNGTNGGTTHDLWSSPDGVNWTKELSTLPWISKEGAATVVFDSRLWLLGGNAGWPTHDNDVWSTTDGVTWMQEIAAAPWTGRAYYTAEVFKGRMWILGGWAKQSLNYWSLNDVWSSPDGVSWTQEVAAANWSARSTHSTVVFDNKLWVMGGADGQLKNDIWSSSDGINWTQEAASAAWAARRKHTATVFNNRMWVMGGADINNDVFDDIWSSADGINWQREVEHAPWPARHAHTSFVFRNRLWVFGGALPDDAWSYGMHIAPAAMGSGTISVPYSQNVEALLGVGPYVWSTIGGSLPQGLTLGTSTSATIPTSGTPTEVGTFTFTMRVEDQGTGDWAEQEITLKIKPLPDRSDPDGDSGAFGSCSLGTVPGARASTVNRALASHPRRGITQTAKRGLRAPG